MKLKSLWIWVMLVLMLPSICFAENLTDQAYTDVPTAPTQDSVVSLTASHGCGAEALEPDAQSIALLEDIYSFVWKDRNRPARYYDEETQKKIEILSDGADIDGLHMTEAMRMLPFGLPEKDVTVTMTLDVDYQPGQLVIIVLGIPEGEGQWKWFPYRAEVPETGKLEWIIPVAEWAELIRQPISFHVLTDRIGPRGERLYHEETYTERIDIFSKESRDVVKTRKWYTESGEPIADDFRVWVVDLTEKMQAEVSRIGEHTAAEKSLLDWFPEDRKAEALLRLPAGIDPASLIAYDVIALRDENYKDTYGDVNVQIAFGTHYLPEKAMVIMAGFIREDAEEKPYLDWYVLNAEALAGENQEPCVEIGLKQLNLPRMENEPMMLVVISQPLDAQ